MSNPAARINSSDVEPIILAASCSSSAFGKAAFICCAAFRNVAAFRTEIPGLSSFVSRSFNRRLSMLPPPIRWMSRSTDNRLLGDNHRANRLPGDGAFNGALTGEVEHQDRQLGHL